MGRLGPLLIFGIIVFVGLYFVKSGGSASVDPGTVQTPDLQGKASEFYNSPDFFKYAAAAVWAAFIMFVWSKFKVTRWILIGAFVVYMYFSLTGQI